MDEGGSGGRDRAEALQLIHQGQNDVPAQRDATTDTLSGYIMGVATIYLQGDTSPPPLKKSGLDPPTFAIKNILHDWSTSHTMTLI